ncbi:hypothetical protein D3C80_1374130 [compost metagenome]
MADLAGHLNAMQNHIGGGQQMWQRLFLHAEDAGLQDAFVFGGFYIASAFVLDGAGEKAASAAGGVHDLFVQLRINHAHHKFRDRTRCVELTGVTGILQVAQQLLVEVAELVAFLGLVEVHAFLNLVDHLTQQLARLVGLAG